MQSQKHINNWWLATPESSQEQQVALAMKFYRYNTQFAKTTVPPKEQNYKPIFCDISFFILIRMRLIHHWVWCFITTTFIMSFIIPDSPDQVARKMKEDTKVVYYRESTMKSLSLHPDSIKQSSQTSPPPSNDFLLPVDSDQAHCQGQIKTGEHLIKKIGVCQLRVKVYACHNLEYSNPNEIYATYLANQ